MNDVYLRCNKNETQATNIHLELFPDRQQPSKRMSLLQKNSDATSKCKTSGEAKNEYIFLYFLPKPCNKCRINTSNVRYFK